METKNTPSFPVKIIDEELGIVEHIITVFGIIDYGDDKSHPGSFIKTITERGDKILVLDAHNTASTLSAVGKPLALREVNRAGLPVKIQEEHPEATGGLWAKTQFLLDVPEGLGVFRRLRARAICEWSYGYDALDFDYETIKDASGTEKTIRNLRTIKLYEYSPVLWGLCPATTTIGTKTADEEKPWRAFQEEGEYCVYKLDENGDRTGSSLGCHPSEDEANSQIAALYASEKDNETEDKAVMKTESDGDHPASHYLVVEDSEKVTTWHLRVRDVDGDLNHNLMGAAWAALHEGYRGNQYEGPNKDEALAKLKRLYEQEDMDTPDKLFRIFDVFGELKEMTDFGPRQRLGDVLQGSIHRTFTNLCDNWYVDGVLSRDERIQLSSLIGDALDILSNGVPEDVATREVYGWYSTMGFVSVVEEHKAPDKAPAPEDLAAETPKEAGPVEPPTSDMLRVIDIELMELELMEV